MCFVVLTILDGVLLYAGPSLDLAAEQLVPGTCYGRGDNFILAMIQATQRAEQFRA